ncbi:nuclear transport factor 2 family protein [Streptomyces sp. NPDC090493]|uniref:nuclear transport factor 2 family protein n=1 Tax=Streptomyces sp. NPDC090493 TaxID=3365964 RepID=UPI0037F60375
MSTETLEEKVARLERAVARAHDVTAIQNLIGLDTYLYEARRHEERFELLARKTPGVTVEIGGRGVFEGLESARRTIVDIEREFERKHGEGMRRTYPDVEFPSRAAGFLETQLVGTPVIEVAGDGETAKGMWIALMATGKTYEQVGPPVARWVWWKIAADFVKEDGDWRIWHYLKNPLFMSAYHESWIDRVLKSPPMDAKGIMAFHETTADRPYTEQYRPYSITLEPDLIPRPPAPYETFDADDSYAY